MKCKIKYSKLIKTSKPKKKPNFTLFTRDNLNTERLKVKAWRMANGLARVMAYNIDFKAKSLTDLFFKYSIPTKGSIYQKDSTIINSMHPIISL